MNIEKFRKEYLKIDKITELQALLKLLTIDQINELSFSLQKCKDFLGITARDKFILQLLQNIKKDIK